MGKTITYSYSPGHFNGQTQSEMDSVYKEAYKEASDCCGASWVHTRSRGTIQIDWGTEESMRALGLYYKEERRVVLNSTRPIGLNTPNPSQQALRIPHMNLHHESIGHYLRWPHVHEEDMSSIMNRWGSVRYMTPKDVLRLQAKFGLPSKLFYPPEQVYYGNIIRAAKKERLRLIPIRNAERDTIVRWGIHELILKQVDIEIAANSQWVRVYNIWKDIPFAGP